MKLRGPDAIGIFSPEEYEARQIAMVSTRGRKIEARPDSVIALVNEGRWLASCLFCNNGMPLHKDWPVARCVSCGSVYAHIVWPEDFTEIDERLSELPTREREWVPK